MLLLDYNKETQRISMRHYSIAVAPSGVRCTAACCLMWLVDDGGVWQEGALQCCGSAHPKVRFAHVVCAMQVPRHSTHVPACPIPSTPPRRSKNLKQLLARKALPDLGRAADVAEFLTRSGYGSVRCPAFDC